MNETAKLIESISNLAPEVVNQILTEGYVNNFIGLGVIIILTLLVVPYARSRFIAWMGDEMDDEMKLCIDVVTGFWCLVFGIMAVRAVYVIVAIWLWPYAYIAGSLTK